MGTATIREVSARLVSARPFSSFLRRGNSDARSYSAGKGVYFFPISFLSLTAESS